MSIFKSNLKIANNFFLSFFGIKPLEVPRAELFETQIINFASI